MPGGNNVIMGRRLATAAALIAIAAAAAPHPMRAAFGPGQAQTPPAQRPSFRASVELLAIDVTVIDKDGKAVRDLTPSDFVVDVGGKRRTVVRSDFIDFSDRAPAPAPAAPTVPDVASNQLETALPDPRLILLLVDDESFTLGEGKPVFLKLAELMENAFPGDAVAFAPLSGRSPTIEFTTDRRPVVEALRALMGRHMATPTQAELAVTEALEIVRGNTFTFERAAERECAAIPGGTVSSQVGAAMGINIGASSQPCNRIIRLDAIAIANDTHEQTQRALRTLARHLEGLGVLPGVKYVLLVSQGIVLDEDVGVASDLARVAAAASVTLQVLHVDRVDPMDVGRPRVSPRIGEDAHLRASGLQAVVGAAGGNLERTIGDPTAAFDRIRRQVATVYRLGVEMVPEDASGGSRPIEVRTTRPGLSVHTHRQVVLPDQVAAATPEARLQRALESPLVDRGIGMRMATFGYRSEDGGGNIVVSAEVDAAPQGLRMAYSVRDRAGKAVVASEVAPESITAQQGALPFTVFRTTAPLGDYTVKLAVVDGEGRSGSVTEPVSLPRVDTTGFAFGDLIVLPAGTDVLHARPAAHIPQGSHEAGVYFELYSGGPTPATHAVVLLDISRTPDGEPLGSTRNEVLMTMAKGFSELAGRVRFSPAGLSPGHYFVRLSVEGTSVRAIRGFAVD